MKSLGKSFQVLFCSLFLFALVFEVGCAPKKKKNSDVSAVPFRGNGFLPGPFCQTKYPVLLVHGVSQRDVNLGVNYFGRVPDFLKSQCRVDVFQGGTDAFSISAVNADQLLERLLHVTDALGYEKVNIMGHSKGGLDIRYMIYKNRGKLINGRSVNDRLASFTSLASPHRGSTLADYLIGKTDPEARQALGDLINIVARGLGDSIDVDSQAALEMLSTKNMAALNKEMGDLETGIPGVYSQSWAANISGLIQDPLMKTTGLIMRRIGSPINDGAVNEDSAPYGEYRGIVGQGILGGVSHLTIVDRAGLVGPGVSPGFDARTFYSDILTELAQKGF